jgi:hypothetical protein
MQKKKTRDDIEYFDRWQMIIYYDKNQNRYRTK